MLLKKQTVWLLTMLSLVVVLSVYYITSPEQTKNELASVEEKAKTEKENSPSNSKTEAKDGKTVVSTVAGDAEFEKLRLELDEARGEKLEELTAIMATTDLPADERMKAKDQMEKLNDIARKEDLLETMIRSMGYEDALVRADGEKVRVTVKSNKKHSKSEANKIILEVKKEMEDINIVAVEFQPSK
ncbi:SpoIIIAH-like family protein [Neobacillus thermocopriae]|uniref:SpoIIIAH-like family protein n=1 Tax=Neobacillus thermocopriae TaxID=1215031 RepID=A0A6B3TP32_9BACI|nr:SpoIIIAH-like family protein [Neobacillus thermocopriae]MED3624427.1 SpoIIIAH-like family protein [Neobacillus thermocopriae]MED3714818.1 SpoIIIAH-like family protein [Neobacillus thermocopriae]NEX78744.1 SpoIIIAH-like family protein [Neobacillus thermocopriae]